MMKSGSCCGTALAMALLVVVMLSFTDSVRAISDCKLNGTWGATTFSPRGNNKDQKKALLLALSL